MSFAMYRAPSVPPSEDLASSGGPSLVPPTLATVDNVPTPLPTRSEGWPDLTHQFESDETLQKIRNQPFELEPEELSTSSVTATAEGGTENSYPLLWRVEFRWEDGILHFVGGRPGSMPILFSRQSTVVSDATVGDATVGDSDGISESTLTSAAQHALVLSLGSDIPSQIAVALEIEEEAYWAREQRREELAKLLVDHYRRTHTAQGANPRNRETSQHTTSFPSFAPYTIATPVRRSPTGRFSRRLVNGGGSGGGEDDDPDDGNHGFRHREGPVLERTRHFACPFQKWRPQIYKQCFHRHRHVSEVKKHVIKRHYLRQCPRCHRHFNRKLALAAHHDRGCDARPAPDSTPGHISAQQLAIIRKRPVNKSLEQQWRELFATIFPNEPQPRDIYVDRRADDAMQQIANHYQDCCRHVLQAEQARMDDPWLGRFDTLEAQRDAVAEQFIPLVMYDFESQETSDWSRAFALNASFPNNGPGTAATDSSLLPPDNHQIQSLAHSSFALMRDSLAQNHSDLTGIYNLQLSGLSRAPPLPSDWHLGSQFCIQPINPPDANHAALDYPSTNAHVVGLQAPVVPQLGHYIDAQLQPQANNDVSVVAPQYMFQQSPIRNNGSINIGSINRVSSFGSSTVAWPSFLPGTSRLPAGVVASSSLQAPMLTDGAYGTVTTTAFGYNPSVSHSMGEPGFEDLVTL